ncbi:MAG: cupin domain-containing protein [Hyphomicrobiaceae bacterium]|nr:cupin domain-containing protein [Hyphomicrobiaceae bacterium]
MAAPSGPELEGLTAEDVIHLLDLEPHPEGGHFRETFRDDLEHAGRSHGTAVYFLLAEGETSRWHRVDASEIWHWYAGAPLALRIAAPHASASETILGGDLRANERPQAVVPANYWQSASSLGPWTLVGCTVAPGFEFAHFEMAPEGWEPPAS